MTTFVRRITPYLPTIALVCILLLGAYLRLYKISEYMTFLGDEGRDMLVIKRMIIDHKFTLLGPTASVGGFFLGPIYYYFMLPFVWASGLNPAGAAVMVALFGIATIYMVYRLGRDAFDEWVGFTAAALYAVSPVVIAYSRSSWNPNLVPFFSTALIYFLWRSVVRNEPKWLFWIGVILGIGLQLHYLFLFLFPIVLIWFTIFGRKKEWLKSYGWGIIGFIVGYGPFLAFELRHGFPNTISIFNFLREGEGTGLVIATFWNNMVDVSYRLFGRLVFRLPPPEQFTELAGWLQIVWSKTITSTIIISMGLLLAYGTRLVKAPWAAPKKDDTKTTARTALLFLLWFTVPLLLFGLYKKGIYDYYFGLFFTLPFIATALILRVVRAGKVGTVLAYGALIGLLYLNWEGRPFKFEPNNQLAQARGIAKVAYEKTDGKPYNFALLTGSNSDHVYRYFLRFGEIRRCR